MAAVPKYKISFNNQLGEAFEIWLCPKGYAGAYTNLEGSTPVCLIRSINNDEDKTKCGIFEKEAVINIWLPQSSTVTIAEFVADEDDDWRVQVWRLDGNVLIFDGYIVVEDNLEPLRDKPYTIQIKATTGLGKLKGIEFTDKDGEKLAGKFSLMEYMMLILDKVNNELPIVSYFNIYGTAMSSKLIDPDRDPLDSVYCFASTFEKDESVFENCYDALTMILEATRCRLFQENGKWHIINLYEYLTKNVYGMVTYDWSIASGNVFTKTAVYPYGVFTSDYIANIGENEFIRPIEGDATKYIKLNTGKVRIDYRYEQPKEVFCNMNLKKGDANATFDGTNPDGDTVKGFDAYCFTHEKEPYSAPGVPTGNMYLQSIRDAYDYEKKRYLVITQEPATNSWARAQRFYIEEGHKLNIDFEHRADVDTGGSGTRRLCTVILIADSGAYYTLDDTGEWFLSNSSLSVNHKILQYSYGSADNLAEWKQFTLESNKTPEGGQIELLFWNDMHAASGLSRQSWFASLNFRVIYYLPGSFSIPIGDYNSSSTNNNTRNELLLDTSISDSPFRSAKGSLVKSDNTLMPTEWKVYAATTNYRFTQIMSYILWNHLRRPLYKIEATLKGYIYENTVSVQLPCGFLNQYIFKDFDNDRLFMLAGTYELDLQSGTWRGVFVECVESSTSTDYIEPDNFKFDYLFN